VTSPIYTFMQHPLTPSDRLWLTELARSPGLSPKFAKVKLYGQLPPEFSPDHIDPRLYFAGRLTPIGLWHVDQYNLLFHSMDQTILDIQRRIRADPTLSAVTAAEIAQQTKLTEESVGAALYAIGNLGHFFTQAQGVGGNAAAHSSIQLTDDTAYDEYLRYTELDELLERVYVQRGKALETSIAYSERPEATAETLQSNGTQEVVRVEQEEDRNWNGVAPEVQRAVQAGWAHGMPPIASALYGRWWQLESWLRSLLYVELRAKLGRAWEDALPKISELRQQGENEFRYMATPDAQDRLAYADASALFRITLEHWNLFASSLPAKNVWTGRVDELLAIRNRIGHCRRPHSDDLVRLEQTLRDLDRGAFAATAAFNEQWRAEENWTDDLVDRWVRKCHHTAARLIEHAERQYETSFELRYSRRPWTKSPGKQHSITGLPGHIWHAFWYFRGGRSFYLDKFWRDIECCRDLILLVCADSPSSISVSFAAMEDPKAIADVIGLCFDAALMRIGSTHATDDYMQWQERYTEVDPRVQVGTPWSSIDESMRGISVFAA
jgi:Swt1-like HEPN